MVRAQCFVNVVVCHAISNPAWCSIIRDTSCFSFSILGRCFVIVFLGKALNRQIHHLTQVKISTWKKKEKVYLTVNTWLGRPPLKPHMVAGIEA